jgi:hypothetical protein
VASTKFIHVLQDPLLAIDAALEQYPESLTVAALVAVTIAAHEAYDR